ncbi:MAG: HAD-IIA family hydrolase [Bacillota bacterium]|nr:HAD-IIA family hydrolase [Bacillota bacterium]
MKTYCFDLDGTMYRGNLIIESAKTFLDHCIQNGIPFIFLTNNAMRTRDENRIHMENVGYQNISADMFYNSAMASCEYVKKNFEGRKAYFIGQSGLEEALLENGFEITEKNPDYVFIGLDKNASYASYSKALSFLLEGAKLIGTNKDRILAKPEGFEIGNGAIIAMFEYATGQISPDIAKPSKQILELCLAHFNLTKEDIILVGDNLETDIRLGYENGVETIFVQTGIHKKEDIEKIGVFPTHIVDTLEDLLPKK